MIAAMINPDPSKRRETEGPELLRVARALKPWEIAARRRNAPKSQGPNTPAGRRRARLNLERTSLCSPFRELEMAALGEDTKEFRRIHRDLVALLQPRRESTRARVEDLAAAWSNKAAALHSRRLPLGYDAGIWSANHAIEDKLSEVCQGLSRESRKWYYLLKEALGASFVSPQDLRMKMEARMSTFRELQGTLMAKNLRQIKNSFLRNKATKLLKTKDRHQNTILTQKSALE